MARSLNRRRIVVFAFGEGDEKSFVGAKVVEQTFGKSSRGGNTSQIGDVEAAYRQELFEPLEVLA